MKTQSRSFFAAILIFTCLVWATAPRAAAASEITDKLKGTIDRVIEVCEANGVIPGIHTSSVDKARFWAAKGMKMIGFCTDIKLIQRICEASVQELHAV